MTNNFHFQKTFISKSAVAYFSIKGFNCNWHIYTHMYIVEWTFVSHQSRKCSTDNFSVAVVFQSIIRQCAHFLFHGSVINSYKELWSFLLYWKCFWYVSQRRTDSFSDNFTRITFTKESFLKFKNIKIYKSSNSRV